MEDFTPQTPGNGAGASQWMAITQSIGRLDGKMDQLISMITTAKETADDHEVRIRVLEKSHWKRLGAAGFAGAAVGLLPALLGYLDGAM